MAISFPIVLPVEFSWKHDTWRRDNVCWRPTKYRISDLMVKPFDKPERRDYFCRLKVFCFVLYFPVLKTSSDDEDVLFAVNSLNNFKYSHQSKST